MSEALQLVRGILWAIALTHADTGMAQILDNATQELVLLATQGFNRTMIEHLFSAC